MNRPSPRRGGKRRGGRSAGRQGRPKTRPPAGNPRRVAAQVVSDVEKGSFANLALHQALTTTFLDDRDRALCTELVYGTLRWLPALEASLKRAADNPNKKLDKKLRPHLLVAAYQLQHLDERIPAHAAVSEAVALVKKVRPGLQGFANALLRNLGSPLHHMLSSTSSNAEVALAYGFPPALADAIAEVAPSGNLQETLAALNDRPPVALRVFDDVVEVAPWQEQLSDIAKEVQPHAFVPNAFLVDGAGRIEKLPGYDDGAFVVQDPASQLVALLADVQRGDHVVDLCAAPGTKTLTLAHQAGVRGSVLAVDVDEERAQRITQNVDRALPERCGKVDLVVQDARVLPDDDAHKESFDVVLLDAPCSALGTVRRHPEVKLRRTLDDVAANAVLQTELLDAAAALTKVGGVLVFATCSPVAAEGRDQIRAFVQRHPEFSVEPAGDVLPYLPDDAVDEAGCVQLFPHLHDGDAFFAARLRKKAAGYDDPPSCLPL